MSRRPNTDTGRTAGSLSRRTVIRGIGSTLTAGGLASAGVAAGGNAKRESASAQAGGTHGFVQNSECVSLSPVTGDLPVEEFYKYRQGGTRFSSAGPITALEQERTSRLLLYRGPDDVLSLVVIHGNHHIEDIPEGGGAVSFTFDGLPADGEWAVQDDRYEGPDQFDRWELDGNRATIHWTWQGGRTDGAVFSGLGENFSITVEPRFNEDAELYEEHYEGDVEAWEALGGNQTNLDVVSLAMDAPVVIESNGC